MRPTERWLLAAVLVMIDLVIFVVPLTGLGAAYILILRPPWFKRWVEALYANT